MKYMVCIYDEKSAARHRVSYTWIATESRIAHFFGLLRPMSKMHFSTNGRQ